MAATDLSRTGSAPRRMSLARREAIEGYICLAPWAIGFVVFIAGPMVASFVLSFAEYDVVRAPRFVGLANFQRAFFKDELFWSSLGRTFYYALLTVPLGLLGSLLAALLLNQRLRGATFFRTCFFLPHLTPAVAAALLWVWVLQPEFGLVNYLLGLVGIKGPQWFGSKEWAIPSIAMIALWTGIGGNRMMIFLAGLQGVPSELLDAAEVDGANSFQRFRHVTVPLISPTLFFNLILGIIGALQVFTTALVATNGGPAYATWFYALHIYRTAFQYFTMGYASALAWIFFVIVLAFTYVQVKVSGRWVYYAGGGAVVASSAVARAPLYAVAVFLSVLFLAPFYWTAVSSLKSVTEIFLFPPTWVPTVPQWGNYPEVFRRVPFGTFTLNSAIITSLAVLGTLLTSSLVAYSFARFRYPARNFFFMLTLSTMMLPYEVTLIPTYLMYNKLGWLDTYLPLIVPYWFGGNAFSIFLMRQFFLTIPRELDDAARIDGANFLHIFWNVLLPLAGPVLATLAVIGFIYHWNDFLGPLIFLDSRTKFTVALGLRYFQSAQGLGGEPTEHLLMAASVIFTIPCILIFFAAQRYFVQGIVLSGVKG